MFEQADFDVVILRDPSNPPKSISNRAYIVLKTAAVSDWTRKSLAV